MCSSRAISSHGSHRRDRSRGLLHRTTARLLTEVAHKVFTSAAHLAAYAGLASVTRHPWRASIQARQHGAQESALALCLCRLERSSIEGLLRS